MVLIDSCCEIRRISRSGNEKLRFTCRLCVPRPQERFQLSWDDLFNRLEQYNVIQAERQEFDRLGALILEETVTSLDSVELAVPDEYL